jgi:hypothetical protein
VDAERMTVTGRTSVDTAQALTGDVAANAAVALIPVPTGTAFAAGETVTVDAERMLVVDVLGNNLSVRRAWDGSALAAHTTGTHVWSTRQLQVTRAASGTTAAAHNSGAAVTRQVVPAQISTACRALALDTLLNEQSGYARTSGSGENAQELSSRSLNALLARVTKNYKRALWTGTA